MIAAYNAQLKKFSDVALGELILVTGWSKEELAIALEGNEGIKFVGMLNFRKTGSAVYPAYSKYAPDNQVISLGPDFYIHYEIEDISKTQRPDIPHPLLITRQGLSLQFNYIDSSISFDSEDFSLNTGGIIETDKAWYVNKWAIYSDKKHYERSPEKPIFSSSSYK